MREKINGSRYPSYVHITCFLGLVSNSSFPLVAATEMSINGQQRLFKENTDADLSGHYLGEKNPLKLGSSNNMQSNA